jgi:hypothetical protein
MSHISGVDNVDDVVPDMITVLCPANGYSLAMLIYGCTSDLLDFALT